MGAAIFAIIFLFLIFVGMTIIEFVDYMQTKKQQVREHSLPKSERLLSSYYHKKYL